MKQSNSSATGPRGHSADEAHPTPTPTVVSPRLLQGILQSVLALATLVLISAFAHIAYVNGQSVLKFFGPHFLLYFGLFYAPALAMAGFLVVRRRALPPATFIITLIAVCLYVSAVAGWIMPTELVSDFRTMWNAALHMAANDGAGVTNIYERRAALLLSPAVAVLGDGLWVIRVLNTLTWVGIWVLFYDAIRLHSGHLRAQVASVLFVFAPEPILALGIPTHDLWGMFFLALVAWCVSRLLQSLLVNASKRVTTHQWIWAIAAGASACLLQIQRELGILAVCAAVGAFLLARGADIKSEGSNRIRAGLPVLLVIGFLGSHYLAGAGGYLQPPNSGQLSGADYTMAYRLGGFTPSYSTGKFSYGEAYLNSFIRDNDSAQSLARAVALSDFADQPAGRLDAVRYKMNVLAPMGEQRWFYIPQAPTGVRDVVANWTRIGAVLLPVFAIVGLLLTLGRTDRADIVWSFTVLFSAGVLLVILLAGEVQPRYIMFMWLTMAVSAAYGVGSYSDSFQPKILARRGSAGALALACLILLYLGCAFLVSKVYDARHGRILTSWSAVPEGALLSADEHQLSFLADARHDRAGGLSGNAMALLLAPNEPNGATTRICGPFQGELEFRYSVVATAERSTLDGAPVNVAAFVDEAPTQTLELGPERTGFASVPLSLGQGCHSVTLSARLAAGAERLVLELYYPRLVLLSGRS